MNYEDLYRVGSIHWCRVLTEGAGIGGHGERLTKLQYMMNSKQM